MDISAREDFEGTIENLVSTEKEFLNKVELKQLFEIMWECELSSGALRLSGNYYGQRIYDGSEKIYVTATSYASIPINKDIRNGILEEKEYMGDNLSRKIPERLDDNQDFFNLLEKRRQIERALDKMGFLTKREIDKDNENKINNIKMVIESKYITDTKIIKDIKYPVK